MNKRQHVIIDTPRNDKCKQLSQFGINLIDAQKMTSSIMKWKGWDKFDPKMTLIVFPGNGANIVRSYMDKEWLARWCWTTTWAKRMWIPGENPIVTTTRIFPRRIMVGIKDIVVVDDVVSSGATAKKLRKTNEPWIPGVRWHIMAWVAQRARSLRGFDSYHFPLEVGDKRSKVPINSLSTLLSNPTIAESYAHRNFNHQARTLLSILENIRREYLH